MLTAILPAALLALSNLSALDASLTAAPGDRLSSTEISHLLAADTELPPNCTILGNPCIVVRCTAPQNPGDWPGGLYDCSVLN